MHRKIYANSTPFVWSNKNCKKCRLLYWIKAFFTCSEVPFPFNNSYFLTQIPTNKWRVIRLEMHTFMLNYFFSLWWNKQQLKLVKVFLDIFSCLPLSLPNWLHMKMFINDYWLFFIHKRCVTNSQIQVHFNKRSIYSTHD